MVVKDFFEGEHLVLVILGIIGVVVNLILFIDILRNGIAFYRRRNYVVLKKRYGLITLHELFHFIIHSWAQIGYYISLLFLTDLDCHNEDLQFLFFLPIYISMFAGIAYLICWCWRYWMIFYDIKWTQATSTEQWKKLLNPNIGKYNWYIKHRSTYGQLYYMGKIIYSIIIFSIALLTMCLWLSINAAYVLYLLLNVIPYCFIAFLWRSVPVFEDSFLVMEELKRVFRVVTVATLFFFIELITDYFRFATPSCSHRYFMAVFSAGLLVQLTLYWNTQIATRWVMQKFQHFFNTSTSMQDIRYYYKHEKEDALKNSLSTSKEILEKSKTDLSLIQIINNDRGYDLFMKHLATEFSMECLSSVTEFLHYQQYLFEKYFINVKDFDPKKHMLKYQLGPEIVEIPKQVPKSYIVYYASIQADISQMVLDGKDMDNSHEGGHINSRTSQTNRKGLTIQESLDDFHTPLTSNALSEEKNIEPVQPTTISMQEKNGDESEARLERFQEIAYQLYEKYIDQNSTYELNIRGEVRKKLGKQIGCRKKRASFFREDEPVELNEYDCLHLFDDVCKDVFHLLYDSYNRFKTTLPFEALLQTVQDQSARTPFSK